jgi:hypothetical protein
LWYNAAIEIVLKFTPWRFARMDFQQDNKIETQPADGKAKDALIMFRSICGRVSWGLLFFSWMAAAILAVANTSCEINHAISGTAFSTSAIAAVCAIFSWPERRAALLFSALGAFFVIPIFTCL